MYTPDFKSLAITLRSKGKTYSEINKQLAKAVPKSTLSYWCRNVVLPDFYKVKLARLNEGNRAKGRQKAILSRINDRRALISEFRIKNKYLVRKLTNEIAIQRVALAILYYCEGNKWKSHRGLMLGSADPYLLKLYIKLLRSVYGIKGSCLRARVSHRADQNIRELENYWSGITGIPIKNFYKTIPDPRTTGRPTKNPDYKGVCVISCAGTKIQLELEEIVRILSGFKGNS
jgi:hypothetical protein